MVLERDSSLLGYPGETSKPLDADHHGVCKYSSPKDPSYITVRNFLKSVVSKISLSQSERPGAADRRRSRDLKAVLAIAEYPDVDYIFFRDQWVPGTNEWILSHGAFIDWLDVQSSPQQVLWLKGGPATGKSVLSSFIINTLFEGGFCCQYFFIRYGDRTKRSMNLLLRSLAYQVAQQIPSFLQKILELEDEAIDFEAANPRTIWDRIFKSILFKLRAPKALYWVIDGIDEADDPRAILRLISDLAVSTTCIRILLVSRETSEISANLERLPNNIALQAITIEGLVDDLRCYIRRELDLSRTNDIKDSIVERILRGAQENFLVSSIGRLRLPFADLVVGTACRSEGELLPYAFRRRPSAQGIPIWHGSDIRSNGFCGCWKQLAFRCISGVCRSPMRHLFIPCADDGGALTSTGGRYS